MEKQDTESPIHCNIVGQPDRASLVHNFQFSTGEDEKKSQRRMEASRDDNRETMRWFFMSFLMIWLLVAVVLPIIAFCLTKSPLCLSLFGNLAPPLYVLYRITGYLFPKSREEITLQAMRIQRGGGKLRGKGD